MQHHLITSDVGGSENFTSLIEMKPIISEEPLKPNKDDLLKNGMTIDDVIERLPPAGKYQYQMTAVVFLYYISSAFLNYNFSFILLNPGPQLPNYTCFYKDGSSFQCSLRYDICPSLQSGKGTIVSWVRDPSDTAYLHNWIERLGLECAEPYKIGMFGTLSYFGEVVTNLVFPPLSDRYGRSYFTYGGTVVQLLDYSIFAISTSYTLNMSLMLFFGLSVAMRYSVSYTHMLELYPKKTAAFLSSILFFTDGFNAMYAPCILLVFKDT